MSKEHDNDAGPELEFKTCGWISGVEILAANGRGARAYLLVEKSEPSAESGEWSVEAESLGSCAQGELVALICKRKAGLFSSTTTEAALAWRMHDNGKTRLRGAGGSAPDHGGAWVPSLAASLAPSEDPMSAALGAIQNLGAEGLQSLQNAIGTMLAAKLAERAGLAELASALSGEAAEAQAAPLEK